jgi:hypothetical protein
MVTGALDALGVVLVEGAGELADEGDVEAARISAIACAVTSSASRAVP